LFFLSLTDFDIYSLADTETYVWSVYETTKNCSVTHCSGRRCGTHAISHWWEDHWACAFRWLRRWRFSLA
jgi:hypothetical protein